MNVSAPPPSLGFSVGIVGHRANRIEDWDGVRARIDEILEAIQRSLDEIAENPLFMAGRHPLRLVTALAEGADRIAASSALDLGQVLEVVLPFEPEEYEKDFPDEGPRNEFRELLRRASSLTVLDGHITGRPHAYEASGYTMLDNIDLLIAVWDGQPGRGRGGTREMIDAAARRAMPVIVIPPDGSSLSVRGAIAGEPMRFEDIPEFPFDRLGDLVASLVGTLGDPVEEADWRSLADLPPNPIIYGAYPFLLKLAGIRPWFAKKGSWTPKPPEGALEEAFAWWDHAAIQAAQAFRSAVLVNFSLAAFAVVLAASSVLVDDIKWIFVAAELLTILLLLTNAWHAGKMRWQERWLESRQVAELLRVGILLRNVGIGRGISDPGAGGSNGWYASSVARSCPMESIRLSDPDKAAEPVLAEIRDQASWNESTSHRMHLAAHRIERFGEVLFAIVILAAGGWLITYFLDHELGTDLKYALTTITAGLPAIATASYGIRIILDFEGVANRAHKIAHGLNAILKEWEAGPHTTITLQDMARRAADIMLGDVAAWRLLAEGRRLTIPG
ncbi:MAG TPA: hypothetical protein VLA37_12140 [Sphingomonadaceae bacterium]|nr:hypothetical protein [Sphingomonadaceae bacterium]